MDIQNTYNPAAFFEEIQNITNEIEGIFKDYNFHIEKRLATICIFDHAL